MKASAIRPEFVEFIPKHLEPGVLYVSEKYRTASHLCACGCGEKVVTPLSPADWQLTSETVRPYPKVGWQCLDSGGCPYIEKTWKVKHVVTTEEINQLTKEYAGMAKEKIDCALTPDDSLPTTACYAEFNLKDVRMSVGADIISKNESKVSVYANEN